MNSTSLLRVNIVSQVEKLYLRVDVKKLEMVSEATKGHCACLVAEEIGAAGAPFPGRGQSGQRRAYPSSAT